MKKINLIIAFVFITASIISCKDKPENNKEVASTEQHEGRDGHPPKGEGDRKGPPKGGSPEQTKTLEEIGGYKIGEVATDFNLKNVDGNMVSLAGIKDAKGYIVTFTCNGCPFSVLYEDRLIELHNKYASQGYSVIAINPNTASGGENESYEAMQKRAKEKGFPFAYLVDEGQKISPQYGAVRTPHVFLLDKDRKVQYIGTIDDNSRAPENVKVKYVEDAIKALENGEKPSPNFTKAIGCPVKPHKV
ncbi:thioredoxin family protein [Aureibaculum algae]|uniref:Thioredoxin family protein n=1 Tax=Aureibaculum algae TaxID=2584122 RepID=A0A5B7TRW4_9FLAO|nr:thioredoxin family protein [Aureibaculum algae]QCX37727.1 thioredoxin family protein [Aureibaculum algae]